MNRQQVVELEGVGAGGELDRGFHRGDVADHLDRDAIVRVSSERDRGLGSGEATSSGLETLDLGRSDRLSAQQEARKTFGAHMSGARVVQRADGFLSVGDVGGDIGRHRQVPTGKRVGEVRAVEAAASITPTHPLELCVPVLPQV